jgi:purine-cytosine permease-like protein
MAGSARTDDSDSNSLDFSTRPVPPGHRTSKGALTMAWWAVSSAVFYFVVAAALAQGFGAVNAIIGMLLSVVVYSIVNGIISRYAIKTGLSVALFSRILFGNAGAALATLIFFVTAIYYAVFEGSVIAVGIHTVFPGVEYGWAALIVILYSVPLSLGSIQTWLDKLNGVLFPLYLLGLVAAVVMAVLEYGYSNAWLALGPTGGAPADGWWHCFVYFMGVWILMMYTFDYARFGREEDIRYHSLFNFGTPFYLMALIVNGLFGIFLVGTVPMDGALSEVSVLLALLKLMGIAGLLFVWVTQTRINTANFHLATGNMASFFAQAAGIRAGKLVWALVVGAIVYGLMLADVFTWLLQALAYQGIFVVAWVAIALTHILSSRYDRLFGGAVEYRSDRIPAFNPCGLAAWFVGAAVGLGLQQMGGLTASFSAPATAVVAAGLYYGLLIRAQPGWFVKGAA